MNDSVEKPTIIYFHTLGRGEVPRLIFELKGIDYDFHTVAHPWDPAKKKGEPWEEYKAKHGDELLFGQYKEPGGVNIVQSASIIRYLARKHGLNGANEQEALEIDILTEGVADLTMAFIKAKWFSHAEESKRQEELKKFLAEALPKHLSHFQRALERNHCGNGYFVGDNVSYLDLAFVVVVKIMQEQSGADKELVKLPASLAGLFTRVTELPAIKKYYDSDPYPLIQ